MHKQGSISSLTDLASLCYVLSAAASPCIGTFVLLLDGGYLPRVSTPATTRYPATSFFLQNSVKLPSAGAAPDPLGPQFNWTVSQKLRPSLPDWVQRSRCFDVSRRHSLAWDNGGFASSTRSGPIHPWRQIGRVRRSRAGKYHESMRYPDVGCRTFCVSRAHPSQDLCVVVVRSEATKFLCGICTSFLL